MYKVIETLTTAEGEIVATCERFANDMAKAANLISEIHDTNRKLRMVQGVQYEVELTEAV